MKKQLLLILWLLPGVSASGQVTIGECQRLARENYPLVKRYGLIGASEKYDLANASKAYLPQFSLSAKATWQTEVTSLPISIPGIEIPQLAKDQYQILGEVSQVVWDGGAAHAAADAVRAQSEVDRAQFEVDMYAIRQRVDQLFFGILILDEQLRINALYIENLQVNYDRVLRYFENGVANRTDLDAIRVEQLAAGQTRVQLQANRDAYVRVLGAFTGREFADDARFVKPGDVALPADGSSLLRPEMTLFGALERQLESQRKSINASQMPRLGLFVQGGYGRPGLNMLENAFRPFAVGGVRMSWNFGALYTRRNNLRKIETGIRQVDVQRETFLFNNDLQRTQLDSEYRTYRQIMADDEEIIRMRVNIVRASEAKLENGIISASDLVRDLTAEQNARIGKAVHEIEVLKTIYEIKNLYNY